MLDFFVIIQSNCPSLFFPIVYLLWKFSQTHGTLLLLTYGFFLPLKTHQSLTSYWIFLFSEQNFSCPVAQSCHSLQPYRLRHASLPCPSLSPRVGSNSSSLSQWCHPIISSSVIPLSSCLQYFPVSGSFPMSWLFTSGSQRIGASVSASVLPMNIQGWFPFGLTGLISLLPKGLSSVFFSTTAWKHQFLGT